MYFTFYKKYLTMVTLSNEFHFLSLYRNNNSVNSSDRNHIKQFIQQDKTEDKFLKIHGLFN
jgi:hypothetical protein